MTADAALFPGFVQQRIEGTDGVRLHVVTGGAGPPLLLLHGWPQTHAAWHRVAPALARDFSLVIPDLRGYGDSDAPPGDAAHVTYSKRRMAADQAALMTALGHPRFAVLAHDRGARVAHRLALDEPARVTAFVSLTVIPTVEMWRRADRRFATGAFHWFLFQQGGELPERLLAADPGFYLDWTLRKMADGLDRLSPEARSAYHRGFARPEVRHAMIEDYRAAATVDEALDLADHAAGHRVRCPVHVLWEAARWPGPETPVEIWRRWAEGPVTGTPVADGHLMAETAPDAVLAAVLPFLHQQAMSQGVG